MGHALSGDQIDKFKESYDIAQQRLQCSEECRQAVMQGLAGDPGTMLSNIKSSGKALAGGPDTSFQGDTRAQIWPTAGLGSASILILYDPFFGNSILGLSYPRIGNSPGFDAAHARALIILHELRHAATGQIHPDDGLGQDWDKEIFEACFRKYL